MDADAREAGRIARHVAAAVADAVGPHLGRASARARVAVAPGGDATLAIDEVAEEVVEHELRAVGDVGFYSEDRGLVVFGTPRWFLVVDPVDGTRPAAAGLESCAVSIGVTPPREDATLGDVIFGVVHELKTGDVFWAARAPARPGPAATRCRWCRRATPTSRPCSGPRGCGAGRASRWPWCWRSSPTGAAWAAGPSSWARPPSP
ncbi:MAG: hypothetical protein FJW95_16670 [Actinobacteria bacterium]|nr:hypothetical protein [Actinomycetota bacterium]